MTVSNIVSVDTDSWSVTFWLMPTSNNVNIFSLVKDDVIFQLKNSSALSYDFIGYVLIVFLITELIIIYNNKFISKTSTINIQTQLNLKHQ